MDLQGCSSSGPKVEDESCIFTLLGKNIIGGLYHFFMRTQDLIRLCYVIEPGVYPLVTVGFSGSDGCPAGAD
jgi:hypothetical protein